MHLVSLKQMTAGRDLDCGGRLAALVRGLFLPSQNKYVCYFSFHFSFTEQFEISDTVFSAELAPNFFVVVSK